MAELPAGTVTFLFTDIEGSTRLVAALRDRYVEALGGHDQLLRDAVTKGGGREIDTQGDSFFFAFPRAIDAVLSAVAAQRSLGAHEWPAGQSVRVRMGIHTGEPIVGGDRYVGLGVHRASRICSAGHGGQILISNVTRQLIEDELPAGIEITDLGQHQLKDMARPDRIFQVVAPGLPADFPPLRAAEAIPESPFAGREADLATAAQAEIPRLRRRGVVLTALALLGTIGVAAGAFALANRGPSLAAGAPEDSVAVIDLQLTELTKVIEVGSNPGPIDLGEDALWVANLRDRTLSRIDLETGEQRRPGLGFAPSDLAAGHGFVWVSDAIDGQLFQLNTFDGRRERTFDLGDGGVGPVAVAVSEDSVWAANSNSSQIVRIDPISSETTAIPLENLPQAISVGREDSGIWVVEGGDAVVEIDPSTNTPGVRIRTDFAAGGIAVGAGSVWVTDPNANSVWRIDLQTRRLTRSIGVGRIPRALAFGAGAIWVSNTFDGTITRIDAQANAVTHTIVVGRQPSGIAVGDDTIWVTIGRP